MRAGDGGVATMRAAYYERPGPARKVLRVGEVPLPVPAPGEVRVRLAVAGINRGDTRRRVMRATDGAPIAHFPRVIPGDDGAGTIDAVGEGVPTSRIGERVWTYEAQWDRPFGTSAEYVALPSEQAVPLPDGASFDEGACLGVPAMTAHRCLFADGPVQGKTVLVSGGAGMVGSSAIGLAKWGGAATVIATVSSEEKAVAAREAGADHVVNYREEDVTGRVGEITAGAGVDRVVEVAFLPNVGLDAALLKPNGTISTYNPGSGGASGGIPFGELMFGCAVVRFVFVYNVPQVAKREAVADIGAALRAGFLRHRIARRFVLEEVAEADEAVEADRLVGRALLEVGR